MANNTSTNKQILDPRTLPILVSSGGVSSFDSLTTGKSAIRRSLQSAYTSPALVRARTLAQEIAGGATNVAQGRRFRHSTNDMIYECYTAGTIGTSEPATWIGANYMGTTPFMSPVGGTAVFVATGRISRASTSPNPAPIITPLGANQAASHSSLSGGYKQCDLAPSSIITPPISPEGPQTTTQKMFRSPNARWWGGNIGSSLNLTDWYDSSTVSGGYKSGNGAIEAVIQTDALGFQLNGTSGADWVNIYIDNIPLTEDPVYLTSVSGTGNPCFVIQFPEGHASHILRVENPVGLRYIMISSRGYIAPDTTQIIRGIFMADSIGAFSTNTVASNQNVMGGLMGRRVGINGLRIMQRGSTGYRQQAPDGSGNNNVAAYMAANPHSDWGSLTDVYMFCHGNNDVTWAAQNVSAYQALLISTWSTARTQHPNAFIAIKDIWQASFNVSGASAGSANDVAFKASLAMYQAFLAWNDSNSGYFNQYADADGALNSILRPVTISNLPVNNNVADTGNTIEWGVSMVGADPNANSAWYQGNKFASGGVHPTQFGNYYHSDLFGSWLDRQLTARGK